MVWNGGSVNLPEIDVFDREKRKKNKTTKSNEIKILRTVAESDTHRSKEAIAFTPDLEHVPLGKVRIRFITLCRFAQFNLTYSNRIDEKLKVTSRDFLNTSTR